MLRCTLLTLLVVIPPSLPLFALAQAADVEHYDVVIVGGTPGGVMTALAVARNGHSAVILDRNAHIGGLPANGLGATDIGIRGASGGLFLEFIQRIRTHYVDTYSADSEQVKAASDGYHFEPHVAEKVFEKMLAEHKDRITVRGRRQFDALPERVVLTKGAVTEIAVLDSVSGKQERYQGKVFIDATYEGDLAAAAGAEYRVGREGKSEFNELCAGRLYKAWKGPVGPGSTGLGDNAIQAYNYRLCLTRNKDNQVPIPKPKHYHRGEFASFAEDVKRARTTGASREILWDGIGRPCYCVPLPNDKIDANNQQLMFLSTDLPEENWPWPTSDWSWRDRFADRLRDYTLGLIWFVQNDSAVPKDLQERCREWGLAQDEYADNGHFPRQVYVREGRRIIGEYFFTAHDALPVREGSRPPIHAASITASHNGLDSHAVRKREPGRVHLDGFFVLPTRPYTVPLGVIVPKKVDGLLAPVPVSGSHVGFSTLRMEPCWMALGQAAGEVASLCIEEGMQPRAVEIHKLQLRLLRNKAVLIYFFDARPGDKHYDSLQFFAVRGFLKQAEWKARLGAVAEEEVAAKWIAWAGAGTPDDYRQGTTTRGELLGMLFERVAKLPARDVDRIKGAW